MAAEAATITPPLVVMADLLAKERGAIRIGPFGSALKKPEYSASGVRVLGIDDVLTRGNPRNKKFIPDAKYRELAQYRVAAGDILVTNMGTVGRAFLIPPQFDTAIISSHLIKVTPDLERVDAHYLEWALNAAPSVLAQIVRDSRGAIMAGFNTSRLKQLAIPLPPLHEQRRIADILDHANALRAKRRAALASADMLATALFIDTFGDPIENPIRFPVTELVNLVDAQRPVTYGILKPGPNDPHGVPYVRVVDMKDGGINLEGMKRTSAMISQTYRRSLLEAGDLLMSIRGHVGRCAVVPPELQGANITQDTARLAITGASPMYVLECLRTPGFGRWMARHTKGVAVTGINLGDVKRMPIPLPSESVQHEFDSRLAPISALTSATSAALRQLDALFASLQYRVFRGEL